MARMRQLGPDVALITDHDDAAPWTPFLRASRKSVLSGTVPGWKFETSVQEIALEYEIEISAGATVTYGSASGSEHVPIRGPYLVVAINSERPFAAPTRVSLAQAHQARLRRGSERKTVRTLLDANAPSPERVCQVFLADSTMSVDHAVLAPDGGGNYWLSDVGSKNGTTLNGERVADPIRLYDGDLIGVGCTFLLYRALGDVFDRDADDAFSPDGPFASAHPVVAASLEHARIAGESAFCPPFLLLGEEGSGRRSLAHAMHEASGCSGAFVEVEAATLLENLLALRSAQGGTLYLRGIEDLKGEASSSLLRALELGDIVARDAADPSVLGVRLVASGPPKLTTLSSEIVALFGDNIAVLPRLSHRREDIGLHVSRFLTSFGAASSTRFKRGVSRALLSHDWPGNLSELWEAIRYALVHSSGGVVEAAHLPATVRESEKHDRERRRLAALLEKHHGNVSAVARALRTARAQVHRLVERYGFDLESYRVPQNPPGSVRS